MMKALVEAYFESWIRKDPSFIDDHFGEEITYTECYGPKYLGKQQCQRWFEDWNKIGTVLKWDIDGVYIIRNTCIANWYFECEYEGTIDGFDGVSIIEFDDQMKIVSVKEYQSAADHEYPYGVT